MELNLQEFTAIRKKIVKNMGEIKYFTKCIKNMIFSLLISEIWNLFILAHLDQLKKGKQLNDKNLWSIFFNQFFSDILSKFGSFYRKMARYRSFQGLFEFCRPKYSKQTPMIISSYGETQANSYSSRNRHPKSTPQNSWKSSIHWLKLQVVPDHALKSSKQPYNP